MSVETFAAVLWETFRRIRKCNIETYGKFSESIKEMNEEELMKLDWELSILDMFITTYCCRLYLEDERICNETLDKLHAFVYGDFLRIDKMLAYTFQEESKIKYQSYFEVLRSDNSFHGLCKAKAFVSAEKEYWKQRDSLRSKMEESANALSLKAGAALPGDLASTVWGLRDGVAFVRHKSVPGHPTVEFRILPITLQEWGDKGLVVPVGAGEISLASAGLIRTQGHVTFINCTLNGIYLPYAEFSHMRYGDEFNIPAVERSILDFQLTLLGLQIPGVPEEPEVAGRVSAEATIKRLEEIASQFQDLLRGDQQEEALQRYLKENPFILHQAAESIPKQRLGEDFVTDFVLVATTTQGPTYTLVELERVTVSPESRALSCCADLPGDSALYAVSVRRLIALHSGFLRTVPHGSALAFG